MDADELDLPYSDEAIRDYVQDAVAEPGTPPAAVLRDHRQSRLRVRERPQRRRRPRGSLSPVSSPHRLLCTVFETLTEERRDVSRRTVFEFDHVASLGLDE